MAPLQVGDPAPRFELSAVVGECRQTLKLCDYRGKKHVVLAFYVLNWTPTCGMQMPAYSADLEKFAGLDAQVVGIGVDSIYSHMAWQKKDIGLLKYPLCSDFYPHAEVVKQYGILREGPPIPGVSERAVFIVDKQGKVAFSKIYALDQVPDNEDCFVVLRKLQQA